MLTHWLAPMLWQSGVPNEAVRKAFEQVRPSILDSVGQIVPELILAVAAMAVLMADLVIPRERSRQTITLLAVGACIATGIAVLATGFGAGGAGLFPAVGTDTLAAPGMITGDSFAAFFKLLILGGTLVTAWFTLVHKEFAGRRFGEFWLLMLTSVLGMFLMVGSTDFLMAYLAIEMVSLTSFVLVGFTRENRKASEAALKYVIYGGMASGLMLYGISFFYGMSGSLRFADLPAAMENMGDPIAVAVASLLVFAGIGYKIAAAPLHFWCPDAYEGAPTPVTAWLSVTSKAAGIALLIRLVTAARPETLPGGVSWGQLVAILSAATMSVGNFAALRQTNMKRLLAYSSIAHAGYLMMAVAAIGLNPHSQAVGQAVCFYLAVYVLMNLGAFAIVLFVQNQTGREDLDAYRGLGWKQPWIGFFFTVLLFSFIGVPPTAGFFGKLYLFQAVLDVPGGTLVWLAVVAGLNTAVSAYYYMSIVKALYLDEAPADAPAVGFAPPALATVAVFTVPVLVLGVFATPLIHLVQSLTLAFAGGTP